MIRTMWYLIEKRMWYLLGQNFKKKGTPAQVFYYEYCEIFKNTCSEKHLRTVASVFCRYSYINHQALLVQGTIAQNKKNKINLFKVNIKDTRTTSLMSLWCKLLLPSKMIRTCFWCLYCWLWTSKCLWEAKIINLQIHHL